ncbi:MAG TPA: S9 family peptidase, partial [Dyadobacter sp.]|nr:S9 family peptidase [Dyadobacter sp.]
MKTFFLTTCALILSVPMLAQKKERKKSNATQKTVTEKKPLNHQVYDFWKDNTERFVSNDGKYFVYGQNPQEGDGRVVVKDLTTTKEDSIPRGSGIRINYDSEFAAFLIKPQLKLVKDAKRAKKKKEDLPKDSLAIYALKTGEVEKFGNVTGFKLSEKGGSWL